METSLFSAVADYLGTTSPKAISEALGTIGKWGATEADYIAFLQNAGYTVLEGSNGQYFVYKVGEFIGGNGTATQVSSVFETTAVETTIEGAAVTEVTATGTGAGILGTSVGAAGAAIAPALGILAGVGLYNLAPDFWTGVADRLTSAGKMIGDKVIGLLDEDGKTSFDEETIEIFKDAFLEAGLFDVISESKSITVGDTATFSNIRDRFTLTCTRLDGAIKAPFTANGGRAYDWQYPQEIFTEFSISVDSATQPVYAIIAKSSSTRTVNNQTFTRCFSGYFSLAPFRLRYRQVSERWGVEEGTFNNDPSITNTKYAKTVYGVKNLEYVDLSKMPGAAVFDIQPYFYGSYNAASFDLFAKYMQNVESIGEHTQEGATLPDANPFPSTYPSWQPSNTINNINYYPVSMPTNDITQAPSQTGDNDNDEQEKTILDILFDWLPDPEPDPQPDPDPQPEPEPQPDPSGNDNTDPVNPNPPPEDSGSTPIIPPVTGISATRMYTVYNPTDSEINALGAFLWTSNIIEQIKKMWEDPLGAIISLHKIYANPVTGSTKNIVLGYIDSGVDALQVTDQFSTVDCGSVTINETKMNATDYTPFTTAQLYLPFVGIVEIDVNEIMNGTMHIVYKVDAYTGTCLALVYVTRSPDMTNEQLLYTYSGNASQTLPLTSANFSGAISSLLGLASAGISVASGGALGIAAGAVTAAHSLTHEMVHVQHSGGLSANAGIMSPRKPFIILSRQNGYDANGYNQMYGYPANKTVFISNLSGYNKVKSVHYEGNGTEEEKQEIEKILMEGFIA